jgi:protein SCO1
MTMKRTDLLVFLAFITLFLNACASDSREKLPVLGEMILENGDTIYPKIPDFEFINQDSQKVTNETFQGKWYIADFFFTSCPTICPKVKKQMLRIYERFEGEERLKILSHSIDTRRDSVPVLKKYAEKIGIESQRWHLVTGPKDDIFGIAPAYLSIAKEDENAPGGFDHSGYIILVDPDRHIRAYCDGTDEVKVSEFMHTLERALKE